MTGISLWLFVLNSRISTYNVLILLFSTNCILCHLFFKYAEKNLTKKSCLWLSTDMKYLFHIFEKRVTKYVYHDETKVQNVCVFNYDGDSSLTICAKQQNKYIICTYMQPDGNPRHNSKTTYSVYLIFIVMYILCHPLFK